MADDWPLIDALMGGTKAMRGAGDRYLPRWPAEERDSYQARLATATLFPAYERTVSIMTAEPGQAGHPNCRQARLQGDVMASRAITDLDPALQPLAQQFLDQCAAAGLEAILTCTYRSNAEQATDYASGRTTSGPIITDEQPGQSAHNCVDADSNPASRAFDFALYAPGGKTLDWNASDDDWKKAISIGQSMGLASGSCWKTLVDNPHFELPDWRATA
jgi:peptidoglycan L-alanyl-D-glutamate endopeptidase CwlK